MTDTTRVIRIIGRLNVGGPAIHVVLLNKLLQQRGFESVLVTGSENENEGTMIDFARQHEIEPLVFPDIVNKASIGMQDARAVRRLVATSER